LNTYLLVALYCFSLWDYYIPAFGGRIFDYAGIVLVLGYLAAKYSVMTSGLRYTHFYVLMTLLLSPLLIAGYYQGKWLAVSAYLVGALLIYGAYFSTCYRRGALSNQIGILITINLIFFFIQYAVFKALGVVVDFHSYFGAIEPRVFNTETGYFRAAGLFQEPNSFCLMLYMLYTTRMLLNKGRLDILFIAALVAMFLSESLWGFGAILVLSVMHASFLRRTISNYIGMLCATFIALGAVFLFIVSPELSKTLLSPITVERIVDIGSDPSLFARYGIGLSGEFDEHVLLGHGLNTEAFQSFLGANAVSFYVFSFGFLSLILFVSWIAVDTKRYMFRTLMSVLFAMTSYPLFTYAIWWAWLGILISISRLNNEGMVPMRKMQVLQ